MPMEKMAVEAFEELQDASVYAIGKWLRLPVAPGLANELTYLNGATSYLFDYLFQSGQSGAEISSLVYAELGADFRAKSLSSQAMELQERVTEKGFLSKESELVKYFNSLLETEDYLKDALADQQGKLALSYIEALAALVLKYYPQQSPLRVCEVLFLRMSHSFCYLYKVAYEKAFYELTSQGYFLGVDEAFNRISGEILD